MGSKESWTGGTLSKKSIREHITPHKISVSVLIQEYLNIKSTAVRQHKNKTEATDEEEIVKLPEPYYRKDFYNLILYLIHCPDMDFRELLSLLESGKYKLLPQLLQNFTKVINMCVHEEVGAFMDIIQNLSKLLTGSDPLTPLVNRGSPIGVYVRRVMLYFDKLNFSQTLNLYEGYIRYVLMGRQASGGKEDEDTSAFPAESSAMVTSNMDLSIPDQPSISIIEDMKQMRLAGEYELEDIPPLWSRRQAELFIARQTALIQNKESSALPPAQLQDVIRQLLQANPDHFEAHYLSYLNCTRVKEFVGAVNSLYHFFDRTTGSSTDKEAKGYRYAALNLVILHYQFGHRDQALAALKEAIYLAHEANDNVCLQHAQAWLYKLSEDNKEILMERSISKCSDLSLNYLTSLGLQSFAQFAGTTGGKPALVFEVLMRSDVLNCQFSMIDLMANSFVHKAALWNLYGKADMATLCSQLLLHLDTAGFSGRGQELHSYHGEATCKAICNVANRLIDLGEYERALVAVDHAKERFPDSPTWQMSEQILYFTRSLYQARWEAAHASVQQLTTLDKWEALLRLGELLLAKGDSAGAMSAVTTVLDAGPSLCPSVRVRALLLAARGSDSASVSILTAALSIANYHYLDYLTALVAMQLAQVQLKMNLPNQALKLMDHSLLVVLSHGGYYDQAQALMLFVKCKVASVATADYHLRTEVIADAIRLLAKVKENFQHMECYPKVKDVVYLQCVLANELECIPERNKFAYEFRQLDEEFPTSLQV